MEYVKVEDNIIVELISTTETYDAPWIQVNLEGGVFKGADVRMYDENWKLRPISELVEEGLVELEKAGANHMYKEGSVLQKVVGEEIVNKTDAELAAEGARELQANERVVDGVLEVMDMYTMVVEGLTELPTDYYLDNVNKRLVFWSEMEAAYAEGHIEDDVYIEYQNVEKRKLAVNNRSKIDFFASNPIVWNGLTKEQQEELTVLRGQLVTIIDTEILDNVEVPALPDYVVL